MVPDHWSNDAMVSMDRCGLIGNLRAESEYWVLPHGYIVLLDGDNLNQLKKPDATMST